MNTEEKRKAFLRWFQVTHQVHIDRELAPFLNIISSCLRVDWAKKSREAQMLSADALSLKLGISRSAYSRLERNELDGSITMANLKRLAEALDCELVYAFRPKSKKSFAEQLWKKLWPSIENHPRLKHSNPHLKANAAAAIANNLLNDTDFRRKQSWVRK